MKIKRIDMVRLDLPQPDISGKARRPSYNQSAFRAFPINKYPEFPRQLRRIPGEVAAPFWVRIEAENGQWGLGHSHWGNLVAPLINEHYAPLLAGRDCRAIDHLNDLMWRSSLRFGGTGLTSMARSGLMLDLNFGFKPEGFRKFARALEPFDMMWLEVDTLDAEQFALIRRETSTPVASLEIVLGRRNLLPLMEQRAVDVGIIDPVYNGLLESLKMAAMMDTYEINVAAHNSHGPLGALIASTFCALIPNFRILECEFDEVPWRRKLLSDPYTVEDGDFVLSQGVGLVEEVARRHSLSGPSTSILGPTRPQDGYRSSLLWLARSAIRRLSRHSRRAWIWSCGSAARRSSVARRMASSLHGPTDWRPCASSRYIGPSRLA